MPKHIITDTGFWIALIDKNDDFHEISNLIYASASKHQIYLPWPIMYETLRTKTVKCEIKTTQFEKLFRSSAVEKLSDEHYKDNALQKSVDYSKNGWPISLADAVIREMLSDQNIKKDYFVTFNLKDFSDICGKLKINVLGQHFKNSDW